MKNYVLAATAILLSFSAFSQATCESFDSQVITVNDKEHAFDTYGNGNGGFLNSWNVTNGTPAIYLNNGIAGVNAFNGSQCALLGVCDISGDWSEGISLQYNFAQGNDYSISLAIRNEGIGGTPTPMDVEFVLLDNPIAYTYNNGIGCSATPNIPVDGQIVHTLSGFAQDSWSILQFNTGMLTATKNHLWIRAKRASGAAQVTTFFLFDSMCVEKIVNDDCYTFEEQAITLNDKEHAFDLYGNGNPGFLSDWHVASGTPAVYYNGASAGVTAFEGSQYAFLGVCDVAAGWNESVTLNHNFQQGHSYEVSMAVRNQPVTGPQSLDVDFILLNSPIAYAYNSGTGCSQVVSPPAGADTAFTLTNLTSNTWQVISFPINNLSADFIELWFRPRHSNGNASFTVAFLFDSVCVKEKEAPNDIAPLLCDKSNLLIYPNPASDVLHLSAGNQAVSVRVFDITGREMMSAENATTLPIGYLAPGLYYLRVLVNGQVVTRKFMKE